MPKRHSYQSQGFSLIEIVLVVGIISLLVITGFYLARRQFIKGRDARRKADIYKIQEAVEEYEKDHDCYPAPELLACDPGNGLSPYLVKIPCDIASGSSYYYDHEDSSCPDWYRLYASLEDSSGTLNIGPGGNYNYYAGSPNAPQPTASATTPPTAAPSSTSSQTPTASPSPGGGSSGFYGCVGGVCVPISWDGSRPGPECDPNFQNATCYDQCGPESMECISWK